MSTGRRREPVLPAGPGAADWDALARILVSVPAQRVNLPGFRESAVLVPIIDSGDGGPGTGPELLFTVRTASLPTHAGQIAFPGGKRDPNDASLTATALREAAEEVGIAAEGVRILGTLDDVATPVGFVITPVVGVVRGPLRLRVHEREVAATFTAGLHELPATYKSAGQVVWQGHRYTMHEFHHGGRRIWGATAAITTQLLDLLSLMTVPPRDPGAIR